MKRRIRFCIRMCPACLLLCVTNIVSFEFMMYRIIFMMLALLASACVFAGGKDDKVRHRILVSTDIGGTDPDDNQSMIHLLMYSNEFDIEGLVSSPSYGSGSKEEILRMIDMYEKDLPKLQQGLKNAQRAMAKKRARDEAGKCSNGVTGSVVSKGSKFPLADYLRSITKQGHKGMCPLKGWGEPTEGSQWIVECARRDDSRPLWILVWGALEDVAQALHDAPDIEKNIRIYWIGGPNKKWGSDGYRYIVEHHHDVWFIENNASYRGFITDAKEKTQYQALFYENAMKGCGVMGNDFINYYKGIAKMGDTPALLYLMGKDKDGRPFDACNPEKDHWGGRFERMEQSPRYIITGPLCSADTVPTYALMEWRIKGPVLENTDCPQHLLRGERGAFTLRIDRQDWQGCYVGDGTYVVTYAPKAPATLSYTITSDIPGFPVHEGVFTVGEQWPAVGIYSTESPTITSQPYVLGNAWWTDCSHESLKSGKSDYEDYAEHNSKWQGAATVSVWREMVMRDWQQRFKWLK